MLLFRLGSLVFTDVSDFICALVLFYYAGGSAFFLYQKLRGSAREIFESIDENQAGTLVMQENEFYDFK